MNLRTRLLSCAALPLASLVLLGGCTSYKNVDACKDRMRTAYPNAASAPLSLTSSTAASRGSRVVVSGEINHLPEEAGKPKIVEPAAVECTFSGESLTGFHWLAPATLATETSATQ